MTGFLAAIRFLTIIPIPGRLGTAESDLSGSLAYFPVAGLLIGLLAAGVAQLLWAVFPALPAAVLTVFFLVAISGGLHMDGLCDTADGFFSSRPRARILEIMRDSRVGAMGVMAIIFITFLKIAALASINREILSAAVILMPLAGRCALLLSMAVLPYVRPEGGLATIFYSRSSRIALFGLAVLLAAGWLLAGPAGLLVSAGSMVSVLVFAVYCRYKIGGSTGDTLGAACELAETMVALVFAANPVMTLLR